MKWILNIYNFEKIGLALKTDPDRPDKPTRSRSPKITSPIHEAQVLNIYVLEQFIRNRDCIKLKHAETFQKLMIKFS